MGSTVNMITVVWKFIFKFDMIEGENKSPGEMGPFPYPNSKSMVKLKTDLPRDSGTGVKFFTAFVV
jgi:hypothetical protein